MAFIRYEQAPISVGYGTPSAAASSFSSIFVTNFTASDNLPLTAVRSLGFNGAISTTATGPIDGSWSMTYLPVTGGSIGSPCKTSNSIDEGTLMTWYRERLEIFNPCG